MADTACSNAAPYRVHLDLKAAAVRLPTKAYLFVRIVEHLFARLRRQGRGGFVGSSIAASTLP